MKIIKKTDSKKKFVKKELYPIVDNIVKKLDKPKTKKIIFFFTENPKEAFLDIVNPERVPPGRQYGKLEYWISENISSFSIQDEKTAVIMINVRDKILRNKKTSIALLAHEYMHILNKSRGIEPKISKIGGRQWPFIIKTLQKIGKDYENVLDDMVKLTTFLILCIKDTLVDIRLIKFGFKEELLEYRKKKNVRRKLPKATKENLVDLMISYVGYENAWIPFKNLNHRKNGYIIQSSVRKECDKIVKELVDISGKITEKEIEEVVQTGLDAYRKLYKKIN